MEVVYLLSSQFISDNKWELEVAGDSGSANINKLERYLFVTKVCDPRFPSPSSSRYR